MKSIKRTGLLLAMALMTFATSLAQTNATQHTVERGETIESIAKKYGVNKNSILKANPTAKVLLSPGMVLTIPKSKNSKTKDSKDESQPAVNEDGLNILPSLGKKVVKEKDKSASLKEDVADNKKTNLTASNNVSSDYDKWGVTMSIGYGFIPKPEDIGGYSERSNSFTYNCAIGANYNFTKSFYVGGRIGYNSSNVHNLSRIDGSYQRMSVNNHAVYLPAEVGYKFLFNDDFGIIPFVGIDMNYLIKSTMESGFGSNKEKENNTPKDDKFCVNGRAGLRMRIWTYDVGVAYVFPLEGTEYGTNTKGFFEVSIGFGF